MAEPLTSLASRGFLFFAYCFWMIWIPWSAWAMARVKESADLAHRLKWEAIMGTTLGIALYLPVLLNPPAVQPAVHSTGHLV